MGSRPGRGVAGRGSGVRRPAFRPVSSPPRSDEEPVQGSEPGEALPGERQTRLSGAWTALAIGVVALAVILVFILQNLQTVEVHFMVFQGSLPLAVALLFAMILGAVVVLAFGAGRILQLRLVARRARRAGTQGPQA
jgi:uncharacterized integral membrane protein